VVLHHELSLRLGWPSAAGGGKLRLHVPARKLVACRTRELHQSLLLKLGRAGAAAAAASEAGTPVGGSAHFIAPRQALPLDLVRSPNNLGFPVHSVLMCKLLHAQLQKLGRPLLEEVGCPLRLLLGLAAAVTAATTA
jgi:hypothetical protein